MSKATGFAFVFLFAVSVSLASEVFGVSDAIKSELGYASGASGDTYVIENKELIDRVAFLEAKLREQTTSPESAVSRGEFEDSQLRADTLRQKVDLMKDDIIDLQTTIDGLLATITVLEDENADLADKIDSLPANTGQGGSSQPAYQPPSVSLEAVPDELELAINAVIEARNEAQRVEREQQMEERMTEVRDGLINRISSRIAEQNGMTEVQAESLQTNFSNLYDEMGQLREMRRDGTLTDEAYQLEVERAMETTKFELMNLGMTEEAAQNSVNLALRAGQDMARGGGNQGGQNLRNMFQGRGNQTGGRGDAPAAGGNTGGGRSNRGGAGAGN
ncbi:MAG: hypothetical protein NUW37_03545 [Planctomycetes bacterium]|nr:hypothetical protein [Planctomycetota bacterium]